MIPVVAGSALIALAGAIYAGVFRRESHTEPWEFYRELTAALVLLVVGFALDAIGVGMLLDATAWGGAW